ncbi:MAG: hypothetical protein R6V05_01745 [Candidatus Brocadiia bacterium]
MGIKAESFVIDEAVLDLIGNEFKFDHAKGIAEWLKNSCDAYIREQTADDQQLIVIRLTEDSRGRVKRIECIDFVGMDRRQIDEAFKRFFDPEAAKKGEGGKRAAVKTLGGHGNGGKFYMRQMFRTARAITYRNGMLNVFGFNAKRQYGFDTDYIDREMDWDEAVREAELEELCAQDEITDYLGDHVKGFTVVRGEGPYKARGTSKRNKLIEELIHHPQARRLIERRPIMLVLGTGGTPWRLTPPRISPKPGFLEPVVVEIPETLEFEGRPVSFTNDDYSWPGRLVLRTADEPLTGRRSTLNTVDFIGEVGVIASYRIHELGASRFSGQVEFIYGECECPILEDPNMDCVRNDRQRLIENERSLALLPWVRDRVEELAEKMEVRNAREKKKQDLRNTSAFNEVLNRWKNRFMNRLWTQVLAGVGPHGVSGMDPGDGGLSGSGKGKGQKGKERTTGKEGGSERKRKPRFPRVLVSGQDADPFDPLASEPFECDPRHPPVYQRTEDVQAGVYWINTSRPLAEAIITEYTAEATRWREYLFQRYVDIIVKEAIYQLGKVETSLSPDDVNRCIDDVVTRIHDQAAQDLKSFLFEEQFGGDN